MSLRTQSQFSLDDIREGIDFVHAAGKKIYLTLNLYTHNKDVEKLPHFVDTLRRLKPDGVLIADPGVFLYLKEHAPELKRFVSTQANICSYQTVARRRPVRARPRSVFCRDGGNPQTMSRYHA